MTARIVILDDCPSHAAFMSELLSRSGFETVVAPFGRRAPDAIRQLDAERRIDLLVTDLFMPDCDGIEILRLARASLPGTAVIAVSGSGSPLLESLKRLGIDAVLTKPVDRGLLLAVVAEILARRHP